MLVVYYPPFFYQKPLESKGLWIAFISSADADRDVWPLQCMGDESPVQIKLKINKRRWQKLGS
jgi:hypothetical protein